MKEYDRFVLLSSLDNPARLLMFTVPELLALLVPFMAGIFVGGISGLLLCCSSVLTRKLYGRWQKKYPPQVWSGLLYWYFPHQTSTQKGHPFPASHVKEYVS